MNRSRAPIIWLALLLLLGLVMRTFGAWVYEFAHTSDHGIICLMVKHMLEGKEFPVFFYGLPYMGSIEPLVSVALCKVFGMTGFWINMGTALVAFAFLPLVFHWGRRAAGWPGGLAALAFCAIGPPQYFQFESWADGGYAAIPFFTCAVLLLALRILERDLEPDHPRPGHLAYLALGVVAGLGWWQSPLLIPAFLVSGFLFLVVLGRRLFTWRLLTAAAGFFLGSLPLWIWNLRNHWQTFDMVKTHDSPALWQGLKLFYLVRLPDLLELHRQPLFIRTALAFLLLLLLGLALAKLAESWRAKARRETLYLAAAFLFLIVFSILFGRSRFSRVNALRYVLIVMPVLGVLLGAATAWLVRRTRRGLGWLPVIGLVALQAADLPDRLGERERAAAFMPKAPRLGAFLREKGIRHLYTDYQVRGANHGLNFLLNEEFVFSPVTRERYRPYARAMEQADNPAVLNDHMGFSSFLKMTGGSCSTQSVEGILVQYDAKPPSDAWRVIDSDRIAWIGEERKPTPLDLTGPLTDGARATGWSGAGGASRLAIRLKQPGSLCGIRILAAPRLAPDKISLEARLPDGSWATVLEETSTSGYFWSGPRFYWSADATRLECRFAADTSDLRLTVRGGPFHIGDIRLMEPDPAGAADLDSSGKQLADYVAAMGVERLYCDRGDANRLAALLPPHVALPVLPHLFERPALPPEITLDARTALLVREREADLTRKAFEARLIPYIEAAPVEPYVVFRIEPQDPVPDYIRDPGLTWVQGGCLRERDLAWAVRAHADSKAGKTAPWVAEAALNPLPFIRYVPEEAQPVTRMARFENGLEALSSEVACANRKLRLNLAWFVPKEIDLHDLWVFVHIQDAQGMTVLQDDHRLLGGLLEIGLERDAAFLEERSVDLPDSLKKGTYGIVIGVYRPSDRGRRVAVESAQAAGKNAVTAGSFTLE